ncbi:extracellular solute-binding protein (plasmid) [Leisingera aquaemixtae]|uniref:extracellular solute-binding protein n=1 Tax=Leisingera aquaemixtae TaxID=1396826 RepID=UPI0039842776
MPRRWTCQPRIWAGCWRRPAGHGADRCGACGHLRQGRLMAYWGSGPPSRPRWRRAANVRAALALVRRARRPMGVVYATDARADSKVSVIAVFPEASHPRIVYPAAAVAGGNAAEAKVFLEYLRSPEARDIFLRHGFGVLAE